MHLRPVVLACLATLLCAAGVARVLTVDDQAPTGALGPGAARDAPAPTAGTPSAPAEAAALAAGERVIEAAPDHFEGAPAPGASSACTPRSGSAAGGGTWAVIVGIDDYPGSGHDLRSSGNDAREVDAALAALGVPSSNRLLLVDGAASSCGISSALDWLVARASPDATAVFFFAGHARILDSGTRAIMAADGAPITDGTLGEALSGLQARQAWMAMATCYGGGFTGLLGPGRILTGAAGANDLAYESLDSDLSYMVEYMVRRAIVGGGAPQSVEAAFAFAQAGLAQTAPNRIPVQVDRAPGEVDLRQSASVPLPANSGTGVGPSPRPATPAPRPATPPPAAPVPPVPTTAANKCLLGLICLW